MSVYRGVVVVVDDDPDIRLTLEEFLASEGYLVLTARDGHEALARMHEISGPIVALVDLMMPGMDGWELIQAMKRDARMASIPIIVITAHRDQVVSGADLVMAKPLLPPQLLKAIRKYCLSPAGG